MTSAAAQRAQAGDAFIDSIVAYLTEELGSSVSPHDLDARESRTADGSRTWYLPCPRARYLGDDPGNPHAHKGTAATYDGHRPMWVIEGESGLSMGCTRCCGSGQSLTHQEYMNEVVAHLGLDTGDVRGLAAERMQFVRAHRWPTDNGTLIHSKFQVIKNGRATSKKPWLWSFEDAGGVIYQIRKDPSGYNPSERTAQSLFSMSVTAAAGIYNKAAVATRAHAVIVFCEGEKDADTAEAMFHVAGVTDRFVATTMPAMKLPVDDLPASLSDPFEGRSVITAFDGDDAGLDYRNRWPRALWDRTAQWADMVLPTGDVTDWHDAQQGAPQEVASSFIEMLEQAEPVTERPVPADHWRHVPVRTQQGDVNSTHPLNAQHVLRHHPDLEGALRIHGLSRAIMTVDAPFAAGPVVWPSLKELGLHFVEFFADEGVNLSLSAFSPELLAKVAKEGAAYGPHEASLAEAWDGVGRAETLFSSYLPLEADAEQQRALSRMVLTDIVRAMRGERTSETSSFVTLTVAPEFKGVDIVSRLLPGYAASKVTQRVQEKDVIALLRRNIALIQYPLSTLSVFNNFIISANILNAAAVEITPAEFTGPPSFIFVGSDTEDVSGLPSNAYCERLNLRAAQEGLASVMPQMIAEAVAREGEWAYLPPPRTNSDVEQASVMARLGTIGTAVAYYVFHQVDGSTNGDCFLYSQILNRPERTTPLTQVVTSDLHRTMQMYFKDVYGASRSEQKINRELKALWDYLAGDAASRRYAVEVFTASGSASVPRRRVSGFEIETEEQRMKLKAFLYEMAPTDPEAEITASAAAPKQKDKSELSKEDKDLGGSEAAKQQSSYTRGTFSGGENNSSCARTRDITKEELTGAAREVAEILSLPGVVGLDFETHPGAWAYWKAKMIKEGTWPKQPALRQKLQHQNEFNNAPPRRKPCILTVTHESGRKQLLRLTGPIEARRKMLRDVFAHLGSDTELAAHAAQFECEILTAAGVEVDIDCTMIASKLIYAEAYAWDEDDDDGPGFADIYADEYEDIGLIDPETGEMDVSRVQPIGKLRRHSLKACMLREFGEARDKTLRDIDWDSPASDAPEYLEYAQVDADDAVRLWVYYRDAMKQLGIWEGYRNLADAIPAVSEINVNGAILNEAKYEKFRQGLKAEVDACDTALAQIAPGTTIAKKNFNDDMRWWLLEQLWDGLLDAAGDDGPRFADTRAAKDWDALEKGEKPLGTGAYWMAICDVVKEAGYELAKTRGTFNEETRIRTYGMGLDKGGRAKLLAFLEESGVASQALAFMRCYTRRNVPATLWANTADAFHSMRDPVSGRITGNHQIAGAVTGRQNCSRVNLQQVPTEGMAREMFEPAKGNKFIVADYSQVELRVGAIIAEDEVLIDVYKRGVDVHTATGARCFHTDEENVEDWMRKKAKAVNFGSFYGAAGPAIAASLGAPLSEGEELLSRFLDAYPGVAAYRERTSGESGPITILPGRRVMCLPELKGPKRTNYPIQGAAASVQHVALTRLYRAIRERNWHNSVILCLAIHDEIVVECPEVMAEEVAEMVSEEMAAALLEIMPDCIVMGRDRLVDAGVCDHWGEKS